jgi:hypothetical protein
MPNLDVVSSVEQYASPKSLAVNHGADGVAQIVKPNIAGKVHDGAMMAAHAIIEQDNVVPAARPDSPLARR